MTFPIGAENLAEEIAERLLRGGHLLLAGRPSSGKSRLAALVTKKALAARATVLVHSLEISTARWLSMAGKVSNPNQLFVYDAPNAGTSDLSGEVGAHHPDLLVIDYLQLMKTGRRKGAADAPSAVYGELEELAGPASLLCLSQVRRESEGGPWTGGVLVSLTAPPESWLVCSTQGLQF